MSAGFRQKIEDIVHGKDMGKVETILCERDLPDMVSFPKLYEHSKEPHSFIVGQSINGVVTQRIQSLPHLLISGATGGGKSVFFRSTMLSLLKSSPHIQLYLLDMKRGVEIKKFTTLPNVKKAKNEIEAMNLLEALVDEMHRRYRFLEESGHKSIDPARDKIDMIVVGIDEAVALFGKKDIDLVLSSRKISHLDADEMHHCSRFLSDIALKDLGDFFSFEIREGKSELAGPPYGGFRFHIEATLTVFCL